MPEKAVSWSKPYYIVVLMVCLSAAEAQENPSGFIDKNNDHVIYEATFFTRYRPNTALDMVEQVPGFRLSDGSGQRGFGGTAGNILIDGRRPTSKQDQPSDILSRIPASQVERIELIRGATSDIDLQGQVEVVNVIMHVDAPASIRWETSATHNLDLNPMPIKGNISMSDEWAGVEYNAGIDVERYARLNRGNESLFDPEDKLLESTSDEAVDDGIQVKGNLNGSGLLGATLAQFNTELGYETGDANFVSLSGIGSTNAIDQSEIRIDEDTEYQVELGVDFARPLRQDLTGKLILLYTRESKNGTESQRRFDAGGGLARVRAKVTDTFESEAILRLELLWDGWRGHALKLSAEGAYNLLDNDEEETEDTGAGPVSVFVPGANTRVAERRADFQLFDTWATGSLQFEYGMGAEVSRLEQSGDQSNSRNFFYLKPFAMLSYSSGDSRQTRLRVERKVSQLDFDDFVGASVFADDDVALGNPDLRPETTWTGELTHEQRFGDLGVFTITAFHHWITDVQDLLPLSNTNDVPGNIGSGRRWGLLLEGTLPLTFMGLEGARLDLEAYWQDSTVIDPVTGNRRVLSGGGGGDDDDDDDDELIGTDREYTLNMEFRQDFEQSRIAWGWDLGYESKRLRFKVNELDIRDEGVDLNLFVETTRWWGLKFSVEAKNLIDATENRERFKYAGMRGDSATDEREFQSYTEGREIEFTISGSFN